MLQTDLHTLRQCNNLSQCLTSIGLATLFLLTQAASAENKIGAVGYLEPSSGIIDLIGTPGARITEILVEAGQEVAKGQILIRFHNEPLLKAQREIAMHQLRMLQKTRDGKLLLQRHALTTAKLARERMDKKLNDQRQLGTVASTRRELTDLEDLALDAKRMVEKEQIVLDQLVVTLDEEIMQAEAQLQLAEARYEDAFLAAPIAGTVLDVRKQIGESVGIGQPSSAGYIQAETTISIADLSRMYVVCEVYEGDLLRLQKGSKAEINSKALPETLTGTVQRIASQVDTSSRLANVWILLDESEVASRLVGMEVQVAISP